MLLCLSPLNSNNNHTTTCNNSSRLRAEQLTNTLTTPRQLQLSMVNILTTTGSSLRSIGWVSVTSISCPTPRSSMVVIILAQRLPGETPETAHPTPPSVHPTATISPTPALPRVLASARPDPSSCGSSCWSFSVTSSVRTSSVGREMVGSSE